MESIIMGLYRVFRVQIFGIIQSYKGIIKGYIVLRLWSYQDIHGLTNPIMRKRTWKTKRELLYRVWDISYRDILWACRGL